MSGPLILGKGMVSSDIDFTKIGALSDYLPTIYQDKEVTTDCKVHTLTLINKDKDEKVSIDYKQLKFIIDEIKALREEVEALKYAPGGVEFRKAEEHFNELAKDS